MYDGKKCWKEINQEMKKPKDKQALNKLSTSINKVKIKLFKERKNRKILIKEKLEELFFLGVFPIKENDLIKLIFRLLPKIKFEFDLNLEDSIKDENEIDDYKSENEHIQSFIKIKDSLDGKDNLIMENYFFKQKSLKLIEAEKLLGIPTSTINRRINNINKVIRKNYQPISAMDGELFFNRMKLFWKKK